MHRETEWEQEIQGGKRENITRKKISVSKISSSLSMYVHSNIQVYSVDYVGEYRMAPSPEWVWKVRVGAGM